MIEEEVLLDSTLETVDTTTSDETDWVFCDGSDTVGLDSTTVDSAGFVSSAFDSVGFSSSTFDSAGLGSVGFGFIGLDATGFVWVGLDSGLSTDGFDTLDSVCDVVDWVVVFLEDVDVSLEEVKEEVSLLEVGFLELLFFLELVFFSELFFFSELLSFLELVVELSEDSSSPP